VKAVLPAGLGKIEVTDIEEVEPGAHELVIEVGAYSVNRGETFQLELPRDGWRPGKDIAGRVVTAAADGSGPPVGARVVAHLPHSGWAERAVARAEQVAVLPDSVSIEQGAALPLAGLTALRLMRTAGSVIGRRILLTGASGGVGHYFTELAAAAGASITGVVSSPARGERLLELGAETLVYDVADARGPFDLVLESVGGTSLPIALSKVRPGGTLIWFGQASRQAPRIDFFDFFAGPDSAQIQHFHYDSEPADGPDLATLVRLVETGRLHPELGRIEDWSATTEVLEDLRDRRIRGNAVLSIRKETTPLSSTDPRTVVTRYVEARPDRRGPRVPRH
jgi:NADPH:quinone reductase-like Zn-dependent oxidoreductase